MTEPWPIDDLVNAADESIRGIGAGNPRFEAELLLAHALQRPRVFLFTHPEHILTEGERARFDELLGRRMSGEPLQYVLGDAPFRHLTLRVGPGVLIPRSETEVLVGVVLAALARWKTGGRGPQPDGRERPWVIDVGVGAGPIILSLIAETLAGPDSEGRGLWFRPLGIDLSALALATTAENARSNSLPCPHLVRGDLLLAVPGVEPPVPVAAIVSNPPYVSTAEMRELPREIREHEPPVALHGGPDGLDVIRGLLDQSLAFVNRGTLLCFEIGATQDEAVREELRIRGMSEGVTVHPDLAGRPRVVLVEPQC